MRFMLKSCKRRHMPENGIRLANVHSAKRGVSSSLFGKAPYALANEREGNSREHCDITQGGLKAASLEEVGVGVRVRGGSQGAHVRRPDRGGGKSGVRD